MVQISGGAGLQLPWIENVSSGETAHLDGQVAADPESEHVFYCNS